MNESMCVSEGCRCMREVRERRERRGRRRKGEGSCESGVEKERKEKNQI